MVRGQYHTLEMTLDDVAIIVGQPLPAATRVEMAAQCCDDERLDLGGGYATDQSGRRGLILQHGLPDVISVTGPPLIGQGCAHAVAPIVEHAPRQTPPRAPPPPA